MPELFELDRLPSWLQIPEVDTETAAVVRRKVTADVLDAAGLDVAPDPVPDFLWSAAVELAAVYYPNPQGLERESEGAVSVVYGPRAAEILARVRSWGARTRATMIPRGAFPDALSYPDPAEP